MFSFAPSSFACSGWAAVSRPPPRQPMHDYINIHGYDMYVYHRITAYARYRMYVCMYVCMYAHALHVLHACMYVCTHAWWLYVSRMYVRGRTYGRMHVRTYVRTHYARTYVRAVDSIRTCMYVHVAAFYAIALCMCIACMYCMGLYCIACIAFVLHVLGIACIACMYAIH
jgi:hypothetical protein